MKKKNLWALVLTIIALFLCFLIFIYTSGSWLFILNITVIILARGIYLYRNKLNKYKPSSEDEKKSLLYVVLNILIPTFFAFLLSLAETSPYIEIFQRIEAKQNEIVSKQDNANEKLDILLAKTGQTPKQLDSLMVVLMGNHYLRKLQNEKVFGNLILKLDFKSIEQLIDENEQKEQTIKRQLDELNDLKFNKKVNELIDEWKFPELREFLADEISNEKNKQRLSYLYTIKGIAYMEEVDFENAKTTLIEAVKSHFPNGDAHFRLGKTLSYHGDYLGAINSYKNAILVSSTKEDISKRWLVSIHNNIGNAYIQLRESDNAIGHFKKAIAIADQNDRKNNLEMTYGFLGGAYALKGEFKKAKEHLDKSMALIDKSYEWNEYFLDDLYTFIGGLYTDIGKTDSAYVYLNKALKIKIKKRGKQHVSVSDAYHNIANIYVKEKKFVQALEFYNESLELRLSLVADKHIKTALTYASKSIALFKLKRYSEAIIDAEKARDIYIWNDNTQHNGFVLATGNLGLAYFAIGNGKKGNKYFLEALNIQKKKYPNGHYKLGTTYCQLGQIRAYEGNYQSAVIELSKGIEMLGKSFSNDDKEIQQYESLLAEYKMKLNGK